MDEITVGVLALQGAFAKHIEMLRSLDVQAKEVRYPEELEACNGLIIPGGESTTIQNQMRYIGFEDSLKSFAKTKPVFGTCAGLILMSHAVMDNKIKPFNFLDITVERNAYGRQYESFEAEIEIHLPSMKCKSFSAIFIRAPRIRSVGESVKVLATYEDEAILVQQGHHLGSSFHPELTTNDALHRYFIKLITS